MKTYLRSLPSLALALAFVLLFGAGCSTTEIRPESQNFGAAPRLLLTEDPADAAYLGLVGTQRGFNLNQIDADILIVEVFDMYCHYCQSSAKGCNAMYEMIDLKAPDRLVKMLGVGSGNTQFEVDTFRREYGVPYPLVADRAQAVSGWLGTRQIPTLIAMRKIEGRFQPYLKRVGIISKGAAEGFLDKALAPSGR